VVDLDEAARLIRLAERELGTAPARRTGQAVSSPVFSSGFEGRAVCLT